MPFPVVINYRDWLCVIFKLDLPFLNIIVLAIFFILNEQVLYIYIEWLYKISFKSMGNSLMPTMSK